MPRHDTQRTSPLLDKASEAHSIRAVHPRNLSGGVLARLHRLAHLLDHHPHPSMKPLIESTIVLLGFAAALGLLMWLDPNCNLLRIPH